MLRSSLIVAASRKVAAPRKVANGKATAAVRTKAVVKSQAKVKGLTPAAPKSPAKVALVATPAAVTSASPPPPQVVVAPTLSKAAQSVPSWFTPLGARSLLTILDGHAMLYRGFHVYEKLCPKDTQSEAAMVTWAGRAANGYVASAFALRPPGEDKQTEYRVREVAVCFDGGKYARLDALADYKSNRAAIHRPESSFYVKEGIKAIRQQKFVQSLPSRDRQFAAEADDLIHTLVQKARKQGDVDVVVMSHDKDLFQLIDTSQRIFYYSFADKMFIDEAKVVSKLGVRPDQVGDYLSLLGDKVDMIPGVTGVGKTRARKLLQKYDTLENIYGAAVKALAQDTKLPEVPREATEAIVREMPRARHMRANVIALRDVPEAFEGVRLRSLHLLPPTVDDAITSVPKVRVTPVAEQDEH
jgi:5'-3' exonuclease